MPLSNADIAHLRLRNQGLSEPRFNEPEDVVAQLGAVQAQDYAGAKWALGQRMPNATDAAIDRAFNEGKILRTHILRPTWHFVSPADIRWMLELTAPRVHAANAFMYRTLELDRAIRKQSYQVLEKALRGNQPLTRAELASVLETAGVHTEGLRLGYFMMSAELDGVICSGARKGRQFTYALLEERAPQSKALQHDEALAELTRRYFATRGPATLQDFTWWSGLTMADARRAMEIIKSEIGHEEMNGQSFWFVNSRSVGGFSEGPPKAHLLPNYDEYFIGFKDRSAIGELLRRSKIPANSPSLLVHMVILNGQVSGGWKRNLKAKAVIVNLNLLTHLTKAEKRAVAEAANRYGKFLGLPVELVEAG